MSQDEALRRYEAGGHAIEARLCADDPAAGYLPQSGRIVRWQAPAHVRCDHALASGAVVSAFYDSMLAKVVAHARTRDDAIARLAAALDDTVCLGVPTNRGFLARVLRDAGFAAGAVGTAYLERAFPGDAERRAPPSSRLEALAAAALALRPALRCRRCGPAGRRRRPSTATRWSAKATPSGAGGSAAASTTSRPAATQARTASAPWRDRTTARSSPRSTARRSAQSSPAKASAAGGSPKAKSSKRSTAACGSGRAKRRAAPASCSRRCTAG